MQIVLKRASSRSLTVVEEYSVIILADNRVSVTRDWLKGSLAARALLFGALAKGITLTLAALARSPPAWIDTLDTAASFGMAVDPGVSDDPTLEAEITFDPYRGRNFDRLVGAWLPLTVAVNSLNRSMGQPDLYPFALTPATIEKLRFIHGLVHPGR